MAELGCYRGGCSKLISITDPIRKLNVFDTFAGLPSGESDGHSQGEFAADFDDVSSYLSGLNVELHRGFFPTTASGLSDTKFSFVHLDGDLYQTTRDALAFFAPKMIAGGIVVFDDWKWQNCPGVERAVAEFGLSHRIEETVPFQAQIRF